MINIYNDLKELEEKILEIRNKLDKEVESNYSEEEKWELVAKYDSMFGAMEAMRRGEKP